MHNQHRSFSFASLSTSRLGRISQAVAMALTIGCSAGDAAAGPDNKEVIDSKVVVVPCDQIAAEVLRTVRLEPLTAANYVAAQMRAHRDCACEIAHAAIDALALGVPVRAKEIAPLQDERADVELVAAVLRSAVVAIYEDIPDARGCVCDLLTAATQTVGKDARAIARIVNSVLPVIASYEPRLAQSCVATLLPGLSPISLLRIDSRVIEPNFRDNLGAGSPILSAEEPPASPE